MLYIKGRDYQEAEFFRRKSGMRVVNCPVCLKELEIPELEEVESSGCPLCGKRIAWYTCPYCESDFSSQEVGFGQVCGLED